MRAERPRFAVIENNFSTRETTFSARFMDGGEALASFLALRDSHHLPPPGEVHLAMLKNIASGVPSTHEEYVGLYAISLHCNY